MLYCKEISFRSFSSLNIELFKENLGNSAFYEVSSCTDPQLYLNIILDIHFLCQIDVANVACLWTFLMVFCWILLTYDYKNCMLFLSNRFSQRGLSTDFFFRIFCLILCICISHFPKNFSTYFPYICRLPKLTIANLAGE